MSTASAVGAVGELPRRVRLPEEMLRLGAFFKHAREVNGMTLDVVAERAYATKGHLSRIERGVCEPGLLLSFRLCVVLRISLDEACVVACMPEEVHPQDAAEAAERAKPSGDGRKARQMRAGGVARIGG